MPRATRRPIADAVPRALASGLLLAAMVACAAAQDAPAAPPQAPSSAAEATRMTVAVLCDRSDSPAVDALLTVLTEALEADGRFTVLDRRHIRAVLAEHTLSAAGAVREPVRQGRILGAAYFVYVAVGEDEFARVLTVLGIETASGNLVSEQSVPSGGQQEEAARGAATNLVARLRAGAAEAALGLPTAVVAASLNRSSSRRLEFLEDSLRGILEDLLAERGYRLLRRQRPDLLAGETALGASGLARPDAAVLAAVGDLVVSAAFSESPSLDKPFEETPIRLDLEIKIKGGQASPLQLTFTLATLKDLAPQLRQAIPDRVNPADPARTLDDDHLERRLEAARLLASLKDAPRLTLFLGDPEVERKQVEVAQRVVYLDPAAKEAYYHLARSMVSAIVQTTGWHNPKPSPGSWREVADAYQHYLHFPRTNTHHVAHAFKYTVHILPHLYQGQDLLDRSLALLSDYYRWTHSLNATRRPDSILCEAVAAYWNDHPDKRLEFYAWLDRLYAEKTGLALFPFETARAYDQLGDRQKASEYLYDGMITQKPSEIHLNGPLNRPADYQWARGLARLLPEDKAAQVVARLDRRQTGTADRLIAWGGMQPHEMGVNTGGVYGYSYHADRIALQRLAVETVTPEPVPLPKPLLYSVAIRRTPSGLWVQGLLAEKISTKAERGAAPKPGPGPNEYGHRLAIYRSVEAQRWQLLDSPKELANVANESNSDQANLVVSIAQAGSDVLFATRSSGLFVYDLKRGWRHVGLQDGLPAESIQTLAPASDGKSAWLTGGRFLYQYKDATVFLSPTRVNSSCSSLSVSGDRLFTLGYSPDNLFAVDLAAGKTRVLFDQARQRRESRVPDCFRLKGRLFNSGDTLFRRILALDDRTFLISPWGLHVLAPDGRPLQFWWAGAFAYWEELGLWVEGNCPLPPCALRDIIQDDTDPHRLWLLSQTGYPMHDFRFAALGLDMNRPDESNGQTFITAYDWQKNLFSKPLRIDQPCVVAAEAAGDYLYLTGNSLSRVTKNTWILDQPGRPAEAALQASCPDPRVAEASLALLRGDFDQVRSALDRLSQTDLPASKIAAMRRNLDKLDAGGPQPKPATPR